nr:hypothetical protein HmN_000981800 [Hymenolepis microstoma]
MPGVIIVSSYDSSDARFGMLSDLDSELCEAAPAPPYLQAATVKLQPLQSGLRESDGDDNHHLRDYLR